MTPATQTKQRWETREYRANRAGIALSTLEQTEAGQTPIDFVLPTVIHCTGDPAGAT
jgi:hypothetical protein